MKSLWTTWIHEYSFHQLRDNSLQHLSSDDPNLPENVHARDIHFCVLLCADQKYLIRSDSRKLNACPYTLPVAEFTIDRTPREHLFASRCLRITKLEIGILFLWSSFYTPFRGICWKEFVLWVLGMEGPIKVTSGWIAFHDPSFVKWLPIANLFSSRANPYIFCWNMCTPTLQELFFFLKLLQIFEW